MYNYDVDYFINKFSAIPDDKWFVGGLVNPFDSNQRCAIGHCGATKSLEETPESIGLCNLFRHLPLLIGEINDGNERDYRQATPKKRILAALYDLKRAQHPETSNPPITIEDIIGQPKEAATV